MQAVGPTGGACVRGDTTACVRALGCGGVEGGACARKRWGDTVTGADQMGSDNESLYDMLRGALLECMFGDMCILCNGKVRFGRWRKVSISTFWDVCGRYFKHRGVGQGVGIWVTMGFCVGYSQISL